MWHSWTWWGQLVPPSVCHVQGSVCTQTTSCVLDLFMNFQYFNTNLGYAEDLGDTSHTAEWGAAEKPKYSICSLKIYSQELSPGWMCLLGSHSDGLEW